jgi:hypothetical protein
LLSNNDPLDAPLFVAGDVEFVLVVLVIIDVPVIAVVLVLVLVTIVEFVSGLAVLLDGVFAKVPGRTLMLGEEF